MSGFPNGLRPEDWMGDLVNKKLDADRRVEITVTEFRYPGSHDAATYKSGLADFSYQCQEKNFYEQMKTGQRAFDMRLAPEDHGKKFIPIHGAAKNTGDDFNSGPKQAKGNDLAAQIMQFAKEHPGEILILKTKMDGVNSDELRKAWADTAWAVLGERLLPAPEKDQPNPKYHEAVESNKNIILAMGMKLDEKHPLASHLWNTGANTPNWIGDGNELLWNEPTWQSGDLDKVIKSTEKFINENQAKLAERKRFWAASLQLTPVLGQGIVTFFKEGASIRPKDLALGGGIGSHGKFDGSNAELRQKGILKKALWKNHASLIMYDFCDTKTTGNIVAMNLPGAGGDDDDDGPSGGKVEGHHRGGGGGGHRGGRGRGHD